MTKKAIASREWNKAHAERVKASGMAWEIRNPSRKRILHVQKEFGLSEKLYNFILDKQDGKCAICDIKITNRHPDVDHDHMTKVVRGLLCNNCNRGLGHFKDSISNLKQAVEYLEEYQDMMAFCKETGYALDSVG